MKRNIILLAIFGVCLIYSCKKDSDPFFDSFPKKYTYYNTVLVKDIQLFTNGTEVLDPTSILNFEKGNMFFDLNHISSFYTDSYMEFRSKNMIKYFGFFNNEYDTLFYTKSGDNLHLRTEAFYTWFYNFSCKSIPCRLTKWKNDSISYKPYFGLVVIKNKEYTISNNEIHIPIIGYKYSKLGVWLSGSYGFMENEFNSEVIKDLTTHDSLAIVKFEVILRQE
jgi:hypothetical protein